MPFEGANANIVIAPETSGALDFYEEITDEGHLLLSRMWSEGVRSVITHFSVGEGGIDWTTIPARATPVDTSSDALESEIYKAAISTIEYPNSTAIAVYCRVGRDDVVGIIGEVGVWATITDSPYVGEIGTQLLISISHIPPKPKTVRDVFTHRVVIQWPLAG